MTLNSVFTVWDSDKEVSHMGGATYSESLEPEVQSNERKNGFDSVAYGANSQIRVYLPPVRPDGKGVWTIVPFMLAVLAALLFSGWFPLELRRYLGLLFR